MCIFTSPFPFSSLTGADLSGADLARANLVHANLANTYLGSVDLRGANLRRIRNADVETFADVATLYKARLDPDLEAALQEAHPELLDVQPHGHE